MRPVCNVLELVLPARLEPPNKVGACNFSQLASHVDNVVDCCMGGPEGRIVHGRGPECAWGDGADSRL